MRRKSLAAIALSATLVLGGTTATANAQSTTPYPISEIQVPVEFVNTVQNFVPAMPRDQIYAGLQIVTAWVGLSIGSSILGSSIR
ncbi:hypothetical protein COCCU_01470 [Corynebacterium occultum]|uniref:Secreted protein n=1 Tax=Corynebacterium occultum TaxID=2675219 RepID=A0A6B8W4C2_9CORY|nr:hypothetical protein [Corynebacterium occultum]QGU06255.1 hypothetical protein COCCU_01470 [Corynebacterium occultum]